VRFIFDCCEGSGNRILRGRPGPPSEGVLFQFGLLHLGQTFGSFTWGVQSQWQRRQVNRGKTTAACWPFLGESFICP